MPGTDSISNSHIQSGQYLGDDFERTLMSNLSDENDIEFEINIAPIRNIVTQAAFGSIQFKDIPLPNHELSTSEKLQLLSLEARLDELRWGFDSVQSSALLTHGSSTPTRFYLNCVYFYIFSLFIVDEKKANHKGLPCGGSAILVLHPLDLGSFITPIYKFLEREYSSDTKLKDIIRQVRNSFLVHGDLSPYNLEDLVTETKMRDVANQAKLTYLLWRLYHLVILVDLKIQAVIKKLEFNPFAIVHDYLSSLETSLKDKTNPIQSK